mgnify:CR=1 FL=1
MEKKLTICIPTYRRLKYIETLLNSIPSEIPVIISDNGNYIKNELHQFTNAKIIHTKQTIPMFKNWNHAIQQVKTEWFIIPGDDDVFLTEKLQHVNQYIEKYKEMGMIIFGHNIINEYDQISKGWIPQQEKVFQPPMGFQLFKTGVAARVPSIIFNTHKFKSCGQFDERFLYTAADSFLIQKLALNFPYVFIPYPLSLYRVWESNYTNTKISSIEWFDQIKLWTSSLGPLVTEKNEILKINIKQMQDKILLDNELFALHTMKKNKISAMQRFNFIMKIGWPFHINLKKHLQLIKNILC